MKHIKIAQDQKRKSKKKFQILQEEARNLPFQTIMQIWKYFIAYSIICNMKKIVNGYFFNYYLCLHTDSINCISESESSILSVRYFRKISNIDFRFQNKFNYNFSEIIMVR